MRPGAALALALLAVSFAIGLPAVPARGEDGVSGRFVDDDGDPGEPYLEWLAGLGAVQGCDPPANTRSCPDRTLNRAEAAKILIVVGQEEGSLPRFPDSLPDHFVDDDEFWDGAASRLANFLAEDGVVDGCDPPVNLHFCPDDPLTRGQVAKLLVTTFHLSAPDDYVSPWIDTEGRFYDRAARVAAYHGLWDQSRGLFHGGDPIDRAEFARVVVIAAGGGDICPVDPFTAARERDLSDRYPYQSFAAYVYDIDTGCAYWMNPEARLKTASVFKVMVMAGTLLEAQDDTRLVTSWEWSQLVPMITESANDPVRALWRHFGGSPWFQEQADNFGLSQTHPVGDDELVWGRTTTSAKDQADLIRQVLLGDWGPLTSTYRDQAWDLMTAVVASQIWGVTSGVPEGWTVAQKNGFAGDITNSVGLVADGDGDGYVIAVMSNGWSDWRAGIPAVEEISSWVAEALAG